jgi:hypothetical protein
MTGLSMNSELKRMRKEVVVAKFEALPWHFPGGTTENN